MKAFIKKSFAVFTSLLTAGVLVTRTATYSGLDAELRNGDTNGDGVVDIYDSINICKHIMKMQELTGTDLQQADYNKDGEVDLYDAIFVSRRILSEDKINEVTALINMKREINGIDALTLDQTLIDASMKRASELPIKCTLDYRPDNSPYYTILTEYGIKYGEYGGCVAGGIATAKELYNAMIKDSDIKGRILNKNFTKIGVGYYLSGDERKYYWAILLI